MFHLSHAFFLLSVATFASTMTTFAEARYMASYKAKGVEVNDKNFLPRFPFLAPAHQGLLQGHGGNNLPTEPDIPLP